MRVRRLWEGRSIEANFNTLAFCGDCGSPIYAASLCEDPPAYSIRLGTGRQRAELVPRFKLWSRSACAWPPGLGDVPRHEKSKG